MAVSKSNLEKSVLTLVIPAFRESERLPKFLKTLLDQLPKDIHIIIVDDGSPATDFEILESQLQELKHPQIELLRYPINRGKGGAIEYGLEHSKSKWVGFLDADGSIPAYEVLALWTYAKNHEDVDFILSSRINLLGKNINRTFKRHLFGRIFVTYLSLLFQVPVYDSQCGFKIFKATVFKKIAHLIQNKRWLWDTELIILAHKFGSKMIEIPIDWKDVPGSKINLISDSLKMALGLWNFKNFLKKNQIK